MVLRSLQRKIKYLQIYGIRCSLNTYSPYLRGQILSGVSKRFKFLTFLPVEITIECTTRCNLKCMMCLRSYRPAKSNRNMNLEEFEHVINQFPHLKKVDLTGQGENLLNNDFFGMVKSLKSRSIFVSFYDNFTLVSSEMAKKLISSKIDSITISLDGATQETYEKIRKGAKFEKVISNIKNFTNLKAQMRSKTPYLSINFVVLKENVHELPALVDLAYLLGIKFVTFTKSLKFNEIDAYSIDSISPEKITRIFNETKEIATSLDVSINFDQFSKTPIKECSYPFRTCVVRCDGSIYPCCINAYLGLLSLGNIYVQEFKKIWKSKHLTEIRKSILHGKVAPYCVGCVQYD